METNEKKEIKQIADIVGEWGKWQLQMSVYIFLICANSAFINIGYSFHAKNMDFWCSDVPKDYPNITKEMKCFKYSKPNERCIDWTYNTTQFRKSIINEFDLVCERSTYASISQSIFMLGYVFSGLIISHFSDKYGRRPIVWLCYSIEVIGIISCGLSYNVYQYIFSRFLVGLGHSGGGWAIYLILLEICGPKHRSDIVCLTGIGWIIGYSVLPGFAYLWQDFRILQLFSAVPMIAVLVTFYFFYESPRWQIINGQVDRAEITIRKALITNGKSVDNLKEDLKQLVENLQKAPDILKVKESKSLLDLIKTPKLRKYTLIMWYSWIVNALIYYGFSFNMSDFGGNFYITFMLSGLVELPSQLLTPLLLRFIGRRKLYSLFMAILALSCFTITPFESPWIKQMFALIGKFAVSSSWSVHSIHGSEIYPTIIRNTGLGASSVVGRIGSMSAPFMGDLANHTSLTFVMIFYGILSAIGAIIGLYLPETKDRDVPDTIEEAENFGAIDMKSINNNND